MNGWANQPDKRKFGWLKKTIGMIKKLNVKGQGGLTDQLQRRGWQPENRKSADELRLHFALQLTAEEYKMKLPFRWLDKGMKEAAQKAKMRDDERLVGYQSPEKETERGGKKADTRVSPGSFDFSHGATL